jgi:RES domain-containing protein
MIVYRVGSTKYANDLSGEGARLNGGRWNHPLTACVYTAASRALAVLELTVNSNIYNIPRALSIVSVEVPNTNIQTFTTADLPGDWRDTPAPASTKDFGTKLLQAAIHPVIRFPSSIIPEEFNYILNPAHPDSKLFKIVEMKDFVYDVRIKLV